MREAKERLPRRHGRELRIPRLPVERDHLAECGPEKFPVMAKSDFIDNAAQRQHDEYGTLFWQHLRDNHPDAVD